MSIDRKLFESSGVALDEEILSSIIGMLHKDKGFWIESHGTTFFELPEGTEERMWTSVIKEFLKDSSRYNMVHPRMMKEEVPYLFFSRRHNTYMARRREITE
jgi:hypothetical protein